MRELFSIVRLLCIVWLLCAAGASIARTAETSGITGHITLHDLPDEARQTLYRIETGGPFPHARDGMIFGNHERRLPIRPRGYYREYTVPTPGIRHRGARRIVASAAGNRQERYYTPDHYRHFLQIVE